MYSKNKREASGPLLGADGVMLTDDEESRTTQLLFCFWFCIEENFKTARG